MADDNLVSHIRFYTATSPSKAFIAYAKEMRDLGRDRLNGFTDRLEKLAPRERVKLPMTDRQKKQVEKCVAFLGLAGYEVTQPIFLVKTEKERIIGQAVDGEIHLMETAFERGTFDLAYTILEEYAHCVTGLKDETRALQDWLFRQIILQCEKVVDEIL